LRLGVEFVETPHTALGSWQWLGQHWLGACLVVLSLLSTPVVALIWATWDDLLAWKLGRFSPAFAVIVLASIPIVRDLAWLSNHSLLRSTVTGLLLAAVALLQFYGQERSERYRKAADDAIDRIGAGVEQQGAELGRIGAGVKQQGAELGRIGAGVESIGSDIGRLAAYLAAEEEEESGS
jgi:hypothetical protein